MGITGFAKFIEETFPNTIKDTLIRNLDVEGRIAVDGHNESYVQMHVARNDVILKTPIEAVFAVCKRDVPATKALYAEIRKAWVSRVLDFIYTDLKGRAVWVIDGENVPQLKEETRKLRREKMTKAREDFETQIKTLDAEEFPNPHKYRKVLMDYVTSKPPSSDDFETLYAVLTSLKIPLVKAWGEGEKTCARLCIPELVEKDFGKENLLCTAVWSADTDSLLFGAPVLIQRKRSGEYLPGQVRVYNLSQIPLSREKLIRVCVANGCDYHPKGIQGLGLKKAYKLYGQEDSGELPEEFLPIVNLFHHDPEIESLRICSREVYNMDSGIVRWFSMIYG